MISRTKDSLQVKQQRMRAEQQAKPRLGRPKQKLTDDPRFSKRITALILLQAGRSLEVVAQVLGVRPEQVRYWLDMGAPIVGDSPVRGITLD
jgi:hypothetical protein